MKFRSIILSLINSFITCFLIIGQTTSLDLDSKLPKDPDVIYGELENGLKYYIRENKKPENRVEMRLAVNAGSILEDEDQLGLAHFVEHMSFNGTKDFEKNELINFLEKTGVKFGADLNAYTSFDETVYMFQIPSDRSSLIDTALLVLHNWANEVSFEDEEIDKERGVIIEEWRLGLGAQDRLRKKTWPVALKGSRYEQRLPIGEVDIIENFKYESIKRFYKDWYRPDLLAVVIVGDINKHEIETKIKEQFSSLKNPENERERKEYDIPDNQEPLITVATDPEAYYNVIQMFYKHPKKEEVKVGDYRRLLLYQLYNGMMGQRLSEILQQPDAPFIYANTSYGSFLGRTKDAYTSVAISKENKIEESLRELLKQNERVKKFGFTPTEMERQKKEILTFYEKALAELGKTESKVYAAEYIRNFLENEPFPGITNEHLYARTFLPEITIEEVNQLAKKWITDQNIVLIITAPEKENDHIPDEQTLRQIIISSDEIEIEAYVDEVDDSPLLQKVPTKSEIVKANYNKEFDYHEFTFGNGAKAVIKSTDFKNDEILFSGISKGGHSLYDLDTYYSAYFTPSILNLSGLGEFNNVALEKKLAGNTANISLWISELNEGVGGSCTPKDLNTLLQLNYLTFTAGRKDSTAFSSFMERITNQIKFMNADPKITFNDTLVKVITQNDPRSFVIPTENEINSIDLEKAYNVYKDRFADASDFTFFLIGNIDIDTIKPYLETYIGGLPAINRNETWRDVEPEFPESTKEITIHKGMDPQGQVVIMMNDDLKWKLKDRLHLSMMMKVFSIRLRETLREDQGGTYGVSADVRIKKYPEHEYTIRISFGCNPENVDNMVNTIFEEIDKIKNEGVEEEELQKVKEMMIRDRETNLKQNQYWLKRLQGYYNEGNEIYNFEDYKNLLNNVMIDDLQNAAKKYFKEDHFIKAVLLPEDINEK